MTKIEARELKKRVLNEYLDKIKDEIDINEKILSDKTWASDGSDYHKECRKELREQTELLKKNVKLLKSDNQK